MDPFSQTKDNHLALTQYYRWYQVYEMPFNKARIDNQLDILASDIEISSQSGTSTGKDNIKERLMMYEGWQNAHHVKHTQVNRIDNNYLSLEAEILYQNIRPDKSRYSYTIHYSTVLRLRDNDLPLFTKVKIEPIETIEDPQFLSAYGENRAKSFMHYWLYLIETVNVNKDKFDELLANQFEFDLSSTSKIVNNNQFKEWLESIEQQVKHSAHYPKNFSVQKNSNQTLHVSVDFDWEGISVNDTPLVAETHHEWILDNNPDERFPRIKSMKVTQKTPFQTKE
ncbi:hypothetical protein [Cytobacillus sp. IB215316]|uniref:hypothetical protein n=1 Tax=Cytobacillus sp. IB215316 TaxID=3097354 RepID=UPI002A134EFD|nr:hypothetical protein [Cytobacillus sp. IB215316]MDX8363215.1 hypothetical protein [Cytobacillus sp. IB215316]